jgi:hypothetical protein
MNTAFLDAVNLAWKIHAVEGGFADRALLTTYEPERKSVAESLLAFDSKYAKLFSTKPSADTVSAASSSSGPGQPQPESDDSADNAFVRTFKESCEFTSGYGVAYGPNTINWSPEHHTARSPLLLAYQQGTRLRPGRLLINADVTRVVDANTVHLEQEIPLNGAFRVYVFAGRPDLTRAAVRDFARHLEAPGSVLSAYRLPPAAEAAVSHHDSLAPHSRFLTFATVLAARRAEVEIARDLPPLLARYRDLVYADDRWDRRVPNARAAAHAKMGLDEDRGGVVVVRPDGYVGAVVRLVEGSGTVDALNDYFSAFTSQKLGSAAAGSASARSQL